MNCRETERLIDTFFDGELDGRLMREAALHITRCRTCERELQEKENVQALLVDTIEKEIGPVDTSRVWAGVQAGIRGVQPEGGEESPWRLAAATSTFRGLLVGSRPARVERGATATSRAGRSSRYRSVGALSVGVVSAAAASVAVLLFLGDGSEQESTRSLANGASSGAAAPVVAAAQPVAAPSEPIGAVARAPQPSAARAESARQVQIDSLEHSGGAMAMWSEPSTTVIWIGDSDPRPASATR